MKRLVTTLAALALATPSIASAESAAKALSLSNAAAQPVRATAPMAKKKLAAVDDAVMIGLGLLAVGGIICVIVCGGSKIKDSP
jgi:hypothetical protein